ncbi:MAG: tRNA preQ1(34) S-adenosylmethionine ribosyltransferase-isomerase QueA [Candidatus Promineifilaceae bacterium]
MLKTSDFDYHLPAEQIAQRPLARRDASRLLVLDRTGGRLSHIRFHDLPAWLNAGDMLVANDSRVIPARLFGRKAGSGGKVELLLLERLGAGHWRALAGGKRLTAGSEIAIHDAAGRPAGTQAEVVAVLEGAEREVRFSQPIEPLLETLGRTPLPPYIYEPLAESERYQTVYARPPGSAAAPTAGLHFTSELLLELRQKGVLFETITLHIGLDTFRPVAVEQVAAHPMHSERASLSADTAERINRAKLAGGRILAVGTTSARLLETAGLRSAGVLGSLSQISARDAAGQAELVCPWRPVIAFEGRTDLFIYPGYRFRVLDGLITNFHLPRSTLIMLVSAFAGRERILEAYAEAVAQGYRFYSFGDAMLIV